MAARYGNYFYNTVFFGLLFLVMLFLLFYFMGWLEFIGLKYTPSMPKLPKPSGK